MEEKKNKSIKELAEDVVKAVFALSNFLEDEDCYITASEEQLDKVRKMIYEALPDYPESQVELVIGCLLACANTDTSEEGSYDVAPEEAEKMEKEFAEE